MGHLLPSALWTLQRQSQLRRCGGNVLLTYFISFNILQNRPLVFNQWARVVCLPDHQKNECQGHQKAPVFVGMAGVLISSDTSHVFMVVGGEGTSPAWWEVHPKGGRMRKAGSFCAVQATALAKCQRRRCCSWGTEAMLGLSNPICVQLFKGILVARHSNTMISHDLWVSGSFSARCACPLFFAGAGSRPSPSRPTQRECAEETSSWKGKPGSLEMAEPLGTAQMSHLPVLSCICSLQAAGFTDA